MNTTFPAINGIHRVNQDVQCAENNPVYTSNERKYLSLLEQVLTKGHFSEDRTGTGTLSLFGTQIKYDISSEYVPLLTTKKVSFHNILTELIWFLNGDTNTKFLELHGNKIWDAWKDDNGDLGPIYGASWRNFNGQGIDQIQDLINGLRDNPLSRRHIVSAWNPLQTSNMALPPCHSFFQLLARQEEGYGLVTSSDTDKPLRVAKHHQVSLMLHQRSADMFLGVPYNIVSYSLLLQLICKVATDPDKGVYFYPNELIHNMGDCHIYTNHIEQVKEQLSRSPLSNPYVSLNLSALSKCMDLKNLPVSVFSLHNYQHHPAIIAPVAV